MRTFPAALLAAVSLSFAVPVVGATPPSWPSLQGGPTHAGVAEDGPLPPYRRGWEVDAGRSGHRGAGSAVVVGDLAIALGREEILAVDLRSGEVVWTVARAPAEPVTPAVSDDGTTLIYPEGTEGDARLVGLDLATRAVRWSFETRGEVIAAPTVAEDTVYVGTRNGFVYALDWVSGDERWRFDARADVRTAPAVAAGRVVVVAEDLDGLRATVFGLAVGTGKETWRFAPNAQSGITSGVAVDDERAYLVLGDGVVRGLNLASGDEAWSRPIATVMSTSTAPALTAGDLIIAGIRPDGRGTLARHDADTGVERWRYRFPVPLFAGAPLVLEGHVVVGAEDGTLYVIDAQRATLVSEIDLGEDPIGPLAPGGDVLVAGVATERGGLVAVENDPSADLRAEPSPSILDPGPALLNYAMAAAAILAGVLLAFRLLLRGRGGPPGGEAATAEGYR